MILPLRVLGSSGVSMIWRGLAMGPISRATWSRSSSTSASPAVALGVARPLHGDEGDDGLPGRGIVRADHGGLGHRRVADQRVLDLGGRDAVARDVHDVVDPAEQPQVAVLVALGAVAGEVAAGEARPVGLLVALVVPVDARAACRARAR